LFAVFCQPPGGTRVRTVRGQFFSLFGLRLLAITAWLLVTFLWVATSVATEVPPLEGRVNDLASLLSPNARQALTQRLAAFEQQTGHQVVVLTIPTLGGEAVEAFSIHVAEDWKLGRAGYDDGVLILVVPSDHRMRIEVGYGLLDRDTTPCRAAPPAVVGFRSFALG
jgi:uncharacterized membrane protein YgcG